MSEGSRTLRRLAPEVADTDELAKAVAALADGLDARCASIVDAIVEASRIEVPEYAKLTPEARERQRARNMFGVNVLTSMLRAGRVSFDKAERDVLFAVGGEIAREPEPLHAVIRTYQIAARELLRTAFEVAPELGAMAVPAVSVAFKLGTGLLSILVESIETAFAHEAPRQALASSRSSAEVLVSDLVVGTASAGYEERATLAGLDPGDWYRAVAGVVGSDPAPLPGTEAVTTWEPQRLSRRALFGRVRHVAAVVVSGDEEHDPTDEVVRALETQISELTDAPVTIAAGTPRPTLAGVHESFDEAISAVESARAVGLHGLLSPARSAVPRLLHAAHESGVDITGILRPILEAGPDRSEALLDTLSSYVGHGCSVQHAAEASHVHRNTMRRHIRTIEELLGFEISERWVEVELALLALGRR